MAIDKIELLLKKFEENISLEKFFLDQGDRDSLLRILNEQEELIPELLRLMELEPAGGPRWTRLKLAADVRLEQESTVARKLGEISKELIRLQKTTKRLQDWQKAWHHPHREGTLTDTYA